MAASILTSLSLSEWLYREAYTAEVASWSGHQHTDPGSSTGLRGDVCLLFNRVKLNSGVI